MSDPSPLPQPRAGVLDIAIYVPGKSKVPNGVELHKLSANENPLGTSPHAQEAMAEIATTLHDYPDGQSTMLREAIASKYGLNVDNIICGSGSDEILSLIANTFFKLRAMKAIYCEHGFLMYPIAIKGASATPIKVDEVDCTANVDNILAAITPKTKIVFLANPNNPTGTYIPNDEVRRLHEGLPSNVILVLDAAYAEYVRRNDYEAGIELVSSSQNVIMTRTFSKIYGLAALRIGWGYASKHILDAMNRVRGPFNVNSAAIAAATAAINDQQHVDNSVAHNDEWLEKLTISLEKIGLNVTPSVGNFMLVHFPEDSEKKASDADAFLTQNGYVLREMSGYGFPNALRMTIGSAEANQGVIKLLTEFMG